MSERQVEVLTQLAQAIAATPARADVPLPLRMCRACVSILGVDGGSLAVGCGNAARTTVCATNRWAADLEDLQEVLGEGPSCTAYHDRAMVRMLLDGGSDQHWPVFRAEGQEQLADFAVYALPIMPGSGPMGVATFHQERPSPLLVDDATGQLLINTVGISLVRDLSLLADELFGQASSWHSRARVDQATGMVMTQLGLGPEDSLALMRAHAYAQGCTLTDISHEILTRRLDLRTVDQDPQGGVS